MRVQIGQSGGLATSGSTYVIAELDDAFTRYKEVTLEAEYRHRKGFLRGSYTRSRYYGNFDQDQSTVTTSNDGNIFIGSSNIGDGAGRQLWDNKLGILRGDRPNAFKIYGSYFLPWHAAAGTYIVAQSGQPWEKWDFTPFAALTTSTSELIKYAEPAGSRRAPSHAQVDLKYMRTCRLEALQRADRYRRVQRGQLADGIQHRTARPRGRVRHTAELLRSTARPRRVQVPVQTRCRPGLQARLIGGPEGPPYGSARITEGTASSTGPSFFEQPLALDQRCGRLVAFWRASAIRASCPVRSAARRPARA
jgi:hypothetical protein